MKLHPHRLTFGVHPLEGVARITIHVTETHGRAAIREQNRRLMSRFGAQRPEVPHSVRIGQVRLGTTVRTTLVTTSLPVSTPLKPEKVDLN